MQVDPVKPTLKAPEFERLKPQYHEAPSNFAFNFNLRRFSWGIATGIIFMWGPVKFTTQIVTFVSFVVLILISLKLRHTVGRCRLAL